MNVALAAVVAAPGLAVGSFLNVVASRVPLHRSLLHPGSTCAGCDTAIAWYDNIPVASWLVLRGRCRTCQSTIPVRYPLVELVTALLVVACALRFGLTWDALVASFCCVVLVAVSAIDLEYRIVPNRIVVPAGVGVLIANTLIHPSPEWILAALGASGFLLVAALAYPRGMGMGDVKLAFFMGAMLGSNVVVGLMVGMLAALAPAVVLAATRGVAATRKTAIPFAPFLAFGAVVALFAGDAILDWYTDLLG